MIDALTIAATGWFTPTMLLTPRDERDSKNMASLFDENTVALVVGHADAHLTEEGRIG